MKIRDLENLEERIDKDFSWRKMELLQLKMAIEKNNVALSKKLLFEVGLRYYVLIGKDLYEV